MEETAWIDSVYFIKLGIQYRALTSGYLGHSPARKLRAVMKGILQSVSPCLNQKNMDCKACSAKEECCYFRIMVEDQHKDYLPYFISLHDEQEWTGKIAPRTVHRFQYCLIGEKARFADYVALGLRSKKWISLDGVDRQKVRFEFASIREKNHGLPINLEYMLDHYDRTYGIDLSEIDHVTLEFLSPFACTYGNRTVTEPERMNANIFLEVLHRRIKGLAESHCGFNGHIPKLDQWLLPGRDIETTWQRHSRFVHREVWKRLANGRLEKELIGGLDGKLSFKGNMTPFFPAIVLGEALHIGNDTTQGLGRYRILQINHKAL